MAEGCDHDAKMEKLVESLLKGTCVPFLGAGMSCVADRGGGLRGARHGGRVLGGAVCPHDLQAVAAEVSRRRQPTGEVPGPPCPVRKPPPRQPQRSRPPDGRGQGRQRHQAGAWCYHGDRRDACPTRDEGGPSELGPRRRQVGARVLVGGASRGGRLTVMDAGTLNRNGWLRGQ